LYSQGCRYLLRNDKDIGKESGEKRESLSQCEARHAIRQMADSVKQGKPFYQQLWFHAPHAPWEMLNTPEVTQLYAERNDKSKMEVSKLPNCSGKDKSIRYCSMAAQGGGRKLVDRGPQMQDKYQSMITDMDAALGKVLRALKELNVERDTLVVFTSDNGPEEEAGCTALWKLKNGHPWAGWDNWKNLYTTVGLRGNKRFVYQGGLHVPTVVQWVGTVPKGRNCSTFAVSTDLFPTFLDAAGLPVPKNVRLDGMSFLSEIVPERNAPLSAGTPPPPLSRTEGGSGGSANHDELGGNEGLGVSLTNVTSPIVMSPKGGEMHRARRLHKKQLHERITFWHNDFEGPRATAARLFDFKLIL
jgi:arylsulfatase A-like enzyme